MSARYVGRGERSQRPRRTTQRTGSRPAPGWHRLAQALIVVALIAIAPGSAAAAAPAPCNGIVQVSDSRGDGHHTTTDVTAAWMAEEAGLQAVIQVRTGNWAPDHEDSSAAGFAFLFDAGGVTHYVRVSTPRPADGPPVYDYGTWSVGGGFVTAGATTGSLVAGPNGTATVDVPAATGAVSGTTLTRLFVLTYDGSSAGRPHWVDRAPGGTTPVGTEFGADYVVGSCTGGPPAPGTLTAVELRSRDHRTGAGKVRVSGRVVPAADGVPVELTATRRRGSETYDLSTAADGSFTTRIPISETSDLRAAAGGLASGSETVAMRSKTRIELRERRAEVIVKGSVDPELPGRVLLIESATARVIERGRVRRGRFEFHFNHLADGRYQAVFIPSKDRAERSTSKGVTR